MKHVLCFGDSNTWGCIPDTDGRRFAHDVRWPGVTGHVTDPREYVSEPIVTGAAGVA